MLVTVGLSYGVTPRRGLASLKLARCSKRSRIPNEYGGLLLQARLHHARTDNGEVNVSTPPLTAHETASGISAESRHLQAYRSYRLPYQ